MPLPSSGTRRTDFSHQILGNGELPVPRGWNEKQVQRVLNRGNGAPGREEDSHFAGFDGTERGLRHLLLSNVPAQPDIAHDLLFAVSAECEECE